MADSSSLSFNNNDKITTYNATNSYIEGGDSGVKAAVNSLPNYLNALIKHPPYKRTHYTFFDSFARANSTTDLGNSETDAAAYTYLSQGTGVTWGISNNQAYTPSYTTAGRSFAYKETNESDIIVEVDVTFTGGNSGYGLGFRLTDVNNMFCLSINPTYLQLSKYVAGSSTAITTVSKTYTSGKLSVLMKGNKIEVYYDGFLQYRTYDSFNNTATKHGLYARGDDATFRFDHLAFKPVDNVPLRVTEDFESNLSKWYWSKETAGLSYSQTFNTSIRESGSQSLRIELHRDDPDVNNSRRCEITLPSEGALEEHWYGVSIFLPNGGAEDYAFDNQPEALIQWHSTPDAGEQNVSPPLSLQTIAGRYHIVIDSDAGRMSTQSSPFSLTQTIADIGSYDSDKGKWVQWAFHVKWGYSPAHHPITEVYKNGVLVYQNNETPNTTNDQNGVYQKLGIYKWPWHASDYSGSLISTRVVYYDNYWMI